jgi:hypothetical protein
LIVILTILAALHTAPSVWAWGRLGHRLTSRIAERRLTPEAKAAIEGEIGVSAIWEKSVSVLFEGENQTDTNFLFAEFANQIASQGDSLS